MAPTGRITRRAVVGAAALGFAGVHGARAAPAALRGTKLTFWGGLIFSDTANATITKAVNDWGAANGVETEVVMINQNETVQKVSAAIASGTMPDVLDLSIDLLLVLSRQGVFLPLDDVYDRVGQANGGWFPGVAKAADTGGAGRTGVPYGISGNLLLRRRDVLEQAGLKTPPGTWEELSAQARKVNKPPLFGLGLALSNVGDGNTQVSVLQAFGGRIADDAGKKAAIKSEATRSYLAWVKDAWDHHLFPPGNTTWDGAGDNNAYLSGQAAFIANTGSVGIAARGQDPDLYDGTAYSPLPGGVAGVISPYQPQVRAVPKTSRNPDAAKALIEHLSGPEVAQDYFSSAIYGPVLQAQARFGVFDGHDPILAGLLNLAQHGTAPGFPDVYNAAYADMLNNYVVPRMVQRIVIDNWDAGRAMDEAQGQTQAIYDKYG